MNKVMRVLMACAVLSVIGSHTAWAKCDGAEKVVRLATLKGSEATPQGQLAKEVQTEFQRSLNGKWCIEFVQPEEGQSGSANLAKVVEQKVDLALLSFDDLSLSAPLHRVFELPFVFRDLLALNTFLTDAGSGPLRRWETKGARSLGLVPYGLEQIAGKKAVLVPADMAGMRFALRADQATRPIISQLRATSRVLQNSEIGKALEEGKVDSQMARWEELAQSGNAERHTNFTRSNHAVNGAQILASSKWLGGLNPADIATLSRAINSAVALFANRQQNREMRAMTKIMRSGKKVYLLTQGQLDIWRETLAPIWSSYGALPGGQAILDGVRDAHRLQ